MFHPLLVEVAGAIMGMVGLLSAIGTGAWIIEVLKKGKKS